MELVFKCKARGNSKLTYQWYKDGAELQGKDEGTLVLKSVTLPDFGWYNCVASCPSDRVESSLAELNVTPHDGRSTYVTQFGKKIILFKIYTYFSLTGWCCAAPKIINTDLNPTPELISNLNLKSL